METNEMNHLDAIATKLRVTHNLDAVVDQTGGMVYAVCVTYYREDGKVEGTFNDMGWMVDLFNLADVRVDSETDGWDWDWESASVGFIADHIARILADARTSPIDQDAWESI